MKEYSLQTKLMGTAFSLGVVADSETLAHQWLAKGVGEIQRIEALLSEFLPASDTARLNEQAGKDWTMVQPETYALLERCQHIAQLTEGDFDITVKPLKNLYQFKNTDFEMPNKALIQNTLQRVGYQKMHLQAGKVRFQHPEMQVSFSAIGKGYASDKVKRLWLAQGVQAGYINASGDLNTFGQKADGTAWKIAIANPDGGKIPLLYIPLQNASVATSGDYEQYFNWQGVRYSHNLNPHTGLPLTGIKSVSVFSPSAELSDALATAVYVKGAKKGLAFLNQLPQTHGIIVDDQNKIYFSNNIEYESYAQNS